MSLPISATFKLCSVQEREPKACLPAAGHNPASSGFRLGFENIVHRQERLKPVRARSHSAILRVDT